MKRRVADIIMDVLVENGITDCFAVVGGGAMHIDNALALRDDINKVFCHHEQACSMAAEGYAKACGKPALVSVTSGPGAINALNGVQGAFVDNVPMIVIAGHPRWNTTVNVTGLNLRSRGVQEYDIVPTLFKMTKYAKMVLDPLSIKCEVKKAIDVAMEGRRGPTWLSIPLDIQGTTVETDELYPYKNEKSYGDIDFLEQINTLKGYIKEAKRPVVLTGSGIRAGGEVERFRLWVEKTNMPIVSGALLPDIMYEGAKNYYGTSGSVGERRGNYILQNADLIIAIGNSLASKQTGFNQELFAPHAKIVMIDAEKDEGKKPGTRADYLLEADIKSFMDSVADLIKPWDINQEWIEYCESISDILGDIDTIVPPKDGERIPEKWFWEKLKDRLPQDALIALGNSSGVAGALQESVRSPKQRVIVNYNSGSMGDDIPEAVGIAVAQKKEVICVTGDGSIMMNLQELQTIVTYNLPVKIVILSNDGYGAIRQTNKNFFNGRYVGCDETSGVGFPDYERVSSAFGFSFKRVNCASELNESLDWFLKSDRPAILEIKQAIDDPVLPRIVSKMKEDGSFETPALQDMYPYLDDEKRKMLML